MKKEPFPGYNRMLAEGRITFGPQANLFDEAPPVDEAAAEKDFQNLILAEAKKNGWKAYHTYDSRKSQAGFPDLVLVREMVIFAELKAETGTFSADQLNWLEALEEAGAVVYRWRPKDWPQIFALLTAPRPPSGSASTAGDPG